MANEIIQEAGKDVGEMMKDFTVEYVKALITTKLQGAMDEAVETVFPSGLLEAAGVGGDEEEEDNGGGDDNGGDDVVEEKTAEEKEDIPPLASGVALFGYKFGTGPDFTNHRYYDLACFAIKPQDSVICKVVKRHGQLTQFHNDLKKKNGNSPPPQVWPKKKMMGKDNAYYRERYKQMANYFDDLTKNDAITDSDYFLKYLKLRYDAKREARLEIFMVAIESLCEKYSINFQYAQRRAERLGFDLEEVEMLKVVAVEKVGREAARKVRYEVSKNLPGFVPGKVTGKFTSKVEKGLANIISTAVETGWGAAEKAVAEIADKLNEVLDKGMDPIKELFNKAMEPIGKKVKEVFTAVEEKMQVDDGLGKELDMNRFPPLKHCIDTITNNGKAYDALEELIKSINEMSACNKFVSYLMYNLGDPEIGKYIPFLNEIQDNHYRLVIALTDTCYLLARASARAFKPLANYADKLAENGYDEKTHEKEVKKVLKQCGSSLASDYYDLPSQCRRMTWWLPQKVTNQLLKLSQTTICQIADILGQVVTNWKPTSKDDARSTFGKSLEEPLNNFISNRLQLWVTIVRRGTESIIADQFMSTVGAVVEEVCGALDDLCSNLPPPLGENLKPGSIVLYLFTKMAENAIIKGVQLLAKNTETIMFDMTQFAEAADENMVRRLRWSPRIRPDNFDPSEPAEDSDDGGDDDNNNKKNDDPNAPALDKKATADNTGDSDDENAAAT